MMKASDVAMRHLVYSGLGTQYSVRVFRLLIVVMTAMVLSPSTVLADPGDAAHTAGASADLSTMLFVFMLALYWMNSPQTARRGVMSGVLAMTLAVVGAALDPHVVNWGWIVGALVLGFVVGVPLSKVPLTAVPQRTALSHAFGGAAAGI